ncbi:uracil-xanthine permease family protein [[Clostridium] polysaccharolyticum]|uniref:Nucleobase:cation symporter-2, NCS2 family n=1 Tax=[Clostridium] polysaccharolyticum TaxID=29364 RepID=A0A1I0A9C0_9FIRM|nr:nucleobase:cation symporter-2 family protein [[Clostridium] polysaccharolyticum]SES90779.1 nucleobase:cation symporter-2, NCS2 family [[Clostridium] polysaccharolyticum]
MKENIYKLDGKISLGQAVPFGLQHILAMFVANITPIFIVAGAAGIGSGQMAKLIQSAMLVAGIGTLIQLFPLWKIGSGLPVVMGISFTFVTVLCFVASTYDYGTAMGAVLVGGIIEGILGLFAKYWRKFITPIVAACVVISIGFSLLNVGANSFGGGNGAKDFGSAKNLIAGTITLLCCFLFHIFAKSYWKQLNVLFGLIIGYIAACFMGMVDFSSVTHSGIISLPQIMPFAPKFNISAIISVTLIFLVSATETIGDTSALAMSGLGREVTEKEIAGSIACDGFVSSLSSIFGCLPITSFSQNVGLIAMTKVVNRYAIGAGAVIMVLAGLFPAVGALLGTLPEAVLGGCTIMMFGTIVASGIQMISRCGFSQRNITIAALSLSVGIGFTQVPEIFSIFPAVVQNVFASNCVAVVFLIALISNLVLPKDMERK